MSKTMYEKIFESHIVRESQGDTSIIYIDRHLVHEVTSPQAFDGLKTSLRKVRQPLKTFATMDHNVSTKTKNIEEIEPAARKQIKTLQQNAKDFKINLIDFTDPDQGIVHIIGPELGITLPGMTIVCGDSHTSTHGAFGSLAFGIGTSEVEHVLATQTLQTNKAKTMLIKIDGELGKGVYSKDVILYIISLIGTAGATGYVVEYAGSTIESMTMESRMTICNMSIEAGARAGMIAPDDVTYNYIKNRDYAPKGDEFLSAVEYWKTLRSDIGAVYDKEIHIKASDIMPQVTWGTNPGQGASIEDNTPDPDNYEKGTRRQSVINALTYMDLDKNIPLEGLPVDKVFIGSCTNGRIEDLRLAAEVVKDKKVAPSVSAIVVPGSGRVKRQAEEEGLDIIFKESGFEWRNAGCSMCLGMNDDQLESGERCASTSNRNFEGRQGPGGRTHLVSPAMAAIAAVEGKITDIRKYL